MAETCRCGKRPCHGELPPPKRPCVEGPPPPKRLCVYFLGSPKSPQETEISQEQYDQLKRLLPLGIGCFNHNSAIRSFLQEKEAINPRDELDAIALEVVQNLVWHPLPDGLKDESALAFYILGNDITLPPYSVPKGPFVIAKVVSATNAHPWVCWTNIPTVRIERAKELKRTQAIFESCAELEKELGIKESVWHGVSPMVQYPDPVASFLVYQ